MPIYEFACQACGEPFEELIWSSSEIDDVVCPQCGSRQVKRKMSAFATIGGGRSSGVRTSGGGTCAPGGG
jgi:putative FmdB family regulatory protein